MLKNYLKVVFRNIKKHRLYSFINIVSLAVGIIACFLISFYVKDELSYDSFFKDSDRIYRVVMNLKSANTDLNTARTSNPLASVLKENFPQVESAIRLRFTEETLVESDYNKKFYENKVCYSGPEFFDIFSIHLVEGNPKKALEQPSSIVITENMARKYFGEENPLGKTLVVKNERMKVTGIIKNIPYNSHLKFDFLASFKMEDIPDYNDWSHTWFYTYVKLKKNPNVEEFKKQIIHVADKYYADKLQAYGFTFTYLLQPLKDIHLYSHLSQEIEEPGSPSDIVIFAIIAVLLLIIACLNFINLTTARYSSRTKEVGIRKAAGASRFQLIRQFISESFVYCICALIIASVVIDTILPWFNKISGKQFTLNSITDIYTLSYMLAIIIFVGIAAGSFPAYLLSSFKPAAILGGKKKVFSGKSLLRKTLVIWQFVISIVLIIGTIMLYKQIQFMKNEKLGFEKEQVVVLPLRNAVPVESYKSLKSEFLKNPSVLSASITWSVPGRSNIVNGTFILPEKPELKNQVMKFMFVDYDFQKTFGIQTAAGRSFQNEYGIDKSSFIINESAMKIFGWNTSEEAVGKFIVGAFHGGGGGSVIGVCNDFHFTSLKNIIEPLVLKIIPENESFYEVNSFLNLKLSPKNVKETMNFLQNKWNELLPQKPYDYFFLDDDFNMQYKADENVCSIVLTFSALAIFVACLGLFGLAAFIAEQRTKEIGVRKVLGASVPSILYILSKEFIKWITIANIIAWPIAYYFIDKWLQDFAYRIEISWWMFVIAGFIAFIIALLTISFQAIKAATANPVESLRYE